MNIGVPCTIFVIGTLCICLLHESFMNKTVFLLVSSLFSCLLCLAQRNDSSEVYRPRIAEFGAEALMDYHTQTLSENQNRTLARNEVDADRLYRAKLAIPIILKKDRVFGAQLKYYQHRFFFEESFEDDMGLYSHLNQTSFVNTGVRLFYKQDLNSTDDFKWIAGAELSSDRFVWNRNSSRYFLSGIYSRQWSDDTRIGVGFAVNHAMQRTGFYPLFIYERALSPKWNLELSLPKSVKLRHKLNGSNYLTASAQLRGWRYNLTGALEDENRDLTLRKADFQIALTYEREVYDWLWMEFTGGYTRNLQYFLTSPGDPRADALIQLQANDAHFAKVSLFVVPPRKFYR